MSRVYRGASYKLLRSKLPHNLVVFDGHCLMCHARVAQVIERNYELVIAEDTDTRRMMFTSTGVPEGQLILKAFPQQLQNVDSVVLIERVPSASGRLQRLNPFRRLGTLHLDGPPEDTDDLCVYTKSKAVFRIMSKLDRFWLSRVGRCGFWCVPRWLGDLVYDYVAKRRRLWGTCELDAVRDPQHVMGLKERTWSGVRPLKKAAAAPPDPHPKEKYGKLLVNPEYVDRSKVNLSPKIK